MLEGSVSATSKIWWCGTAEFQPRHPPHSQNSVLQMLVLRTVFLTHTSTVLTGAMSVLKPRRQCPVHPRADSGVGGRYLGYRGAACARPMVSESSSRCGVGYGFPWGSISQLILSIPPSDVISPLPRASSCGKSPREAAASAEWCFALGSMPIQSLSEVCFPSSSPHTGLSSLSWTSHHLWMPTHTPYTCGRR